MPTEIIRGLWIGSYEEVKNISFLENKNIKLILNISKNIPILKSFKTLTDVKIYRFECDIENYSLSKINKLLSIIHKSLEKNVSVFIYCQTGYQYSPTIATIYLMKYGHISLPNIENIMISKNKNIFQPENILRVISEKYQHFNK